MSVHSSYERAMEIEQELKKYTKEECDELQEACDGLMHLSHYPGYISDECYEAILKELQSQLKNYQDNTEWVEREETKTHKWTELEWKNGW